MGTYEELKNAIQDVIKTNGNNEITGELLQQTLLAIVNTLGKNATYAGVATPTTNPGTPDQNVIYLAITPGNYANFNGIALLPGEIAIISNSNGVWEKYSFIPNNYTPITYAELVNLRNGGRLVPGNLYRITDYETTTTQANTRSAGHFFDVVVLALSQNEISERAWAVHSERDVDGYFESSNLSAWHIWYTLDNDSERFAWADTNNGKGVIYRMIDEWNNDLPYDFKNIMFIRYKLDAPDEYAAEGTDDVWIVQFSKNIREQFSIGQRAYIYAGLNADNRYWEDDYGVLFSSPTGETRAFYTFSTNSDEDASLLDSCHDNKMMFSKDLPNNVFFGNSCSSNSFGNDCNYNSFGNDCYSNSFGNSCSYNSFGNSCSYNSFGNSCYYNSFGNSCYSNSFGNSSANNELRAYYKNITFGDGVKYVTLDNQDTGTSNNQVQNYRVANGTQGTNDEPIVVEVFRNRTYETTVARDSSGEIVEFCMADIAQKVEAVTVTIEE